MSDADTLQVQEHSPSLPLRNDTFLGVCQALGDDFGFHPNWLRVAFSAGLLWNPYAVIGAYLGVGLLVALSRFLFPRPRLVVAPAAAGAPAAPVEADDRAAAGDGSEVKDERELIAA